MKNLLIADLFCGAGGSSTGAIRAVKELGLKITLVCVNHWPVAIETHKKNHPEARHYVEDVTIADPNKIVPEGYLDLLMASPECKYYSRARGGKPVNDQGRMNPWAVHRWLTELDVKCLLVENVPEFIHWGPLLDNGKPDPKYKGEYFQAWYNAIRDLGYKPEWKYLVAADYGDPTTRTRFFLIARKDGKPVKWPSATHSEEGKVDMIEHLKKWRAAREIIDWTNPGRSLLDDPKYKKRPLATNTIRKVAKGLEKFTGPLAPYYIRLLGLEPKSGHGDTVESFVMGKQGNPTYRSVRKPIQTITTDGRPLLVEPVIEPFVIGQQSKSAPRSVRKPIPTIATHGAISFVKPEVKPFIIQNRIRPDGDRIYDIDKPLITVTGHGAGSLVEPVMIEFYGNDNICSVDSPFPTITTKDRFGLVNPVLVEVNHDGEDRSSSVDKPLKTVTSKRGTAIISPFILAFDNSSAHGDLVWSADKPVPTIVTKANKGILMPVIEAVKAGKVDSDRLVLINGMPHYLDLRFRMITNPELAAAMSFTTQEFTYEFVGNGEDVTKQIGNAVPCEMAKALVKVTLG